MNTLLLTDALEVYLDDLEVLEIYIDDKLIYKSEGVVTEDNNILFTLDNNRILTRDEEE